MRIQFSAIGRNAFEGQLALHMLMKSMCMLMTAMEREQKLEGGAVAVGVEVGVGDFAEVMPVARVLPGDAVQLRRQRCGCRTR